MAPPDATDVLFARPSAAFAHPMLGAVLRRAVDTRGETALLAQAERVGFDPRTLERVVVARSPRGVLYLGFGALDARNVESRLWERLLEPRQRERDPEGGVRLEGALVQTPVALRLRPRCSLAAYSEGADVGDVDRVLRAPSERDGPSREEPEARVLLRWRTRGLPAPARVDASLAAQVRALEVRASVADDGAGLVVVLTLRGALSADAPARVRRALDALAQSPLGELTGAGGWLAPGAVMVEPQVEGLRVTARPPWRALTALADALRGDVGLRELTAPGEPARPGTSAAPFGPPVGPR